MCCAVTGVGFEDCDDAEPWNANVLQSPVTTLTTDVLLTFQLSPNRLGSLDVYSVSDVGHFSSHIAHFPPTGSVLHGCLTSRNPSGGRRWTEKADLFHDTGYGRSRHRIVSK